MNAKEVVKALETEVLCETCPHNGSSCLDDSCYYIMAAALIESLQAQLVRKTHQLEESQRRADAAVEDLRKVLAEGGYGCDFCKHENDQAVCAKTCSTGTKLGGWRWRGVQDEKGEADD